MPSSFQELEALDTNQLYQRELGVEVGEEMGREEGQQELWVHPHSICLTKEQYSGAFLKTPISLSGVKEVEREYSIYKCIIEQRQGMQWNPYPEAPIQKSYQLENGIQLE